MHTLKFLLKYGSKGQEVKRLQRAIGVRATGKFGPRTKAAVKEWQKKNGLVDDGIAGFHTLDAMGIAVLGGIDVSDYNRIYDWQAMYDHGVRWCYVKASEGTTHQQKKVYDHVNRARDVGMDVGLYHFSRPDTYARKGLQDARDEVDNLLTSAQDIPYTLPFANDMEKADKTRDEYNVRWTMEFGRELKAETGHMPLIYTAHWFVSGWYNDDELADIVKSHRLWLADYDGYPDDEIKPWKEWTLTQWSGHGYIPGSGGRIDLNWAAGGMLDQIRVQRANLC